MIYVLLSIRSCQIYHDIYFLITCKARLVFYRKNVKPLEVEGGLPPILYSLTHQLFLHEDVFSMIKILYEACQFYLAFILFTVPSMKNAAIGIYFKINASLLERRFL